VNAILVKVAPLALCLAALGCKRERAPEPPKISIPEAEPAPEAPADDAYRDLRWTAVSENGTAVLAQTPDAAGKCRRVCTGAGNAAVWSADGCIGKRIDLRFVSNDCEKVVVIHQLPEVSADSRQWPQAEVVHVYKRGDKDYAVPAGGAVRDWKRVRSAGTTFYWLAGALGQPGTAPRYSAGGTAVEFDTVDGNHNSVSLVSKK